MITEALLATAPTPVPLTVGGHTFRMVPVRGGAFDMGDEVGDLPDPCRPVHRVQLDDFCMGQFPVTQALWRAVADSPEPEPRRGSQPRRGLLNPAPSFFKGNYRPVEQVSWDDAQVFLEKLNQLLPGWNFRLPTEAEWEYAARGGAASASDRVTGSHPVTTRYAGSDRLETVAWWDENSHDETKPVGLKAPNILGLFDMSGNVREWCADWYDSDFYKKCVPMSTVMNPRNDEVATNRVLRGGSWFYDDPQDCWVAARGYDDSPYRFNLIGFRLAASPSSSVVGEQVSM